MYSEPYGLDNAENILFYIEGAPIAELPEGYRSWVGYLDLANLQETSLPFIGLLVGLPAGLFQRSKRRLGSGWRKLRY